MLNIKTFTIATDSDDLMKRFEMMLVLMQFNSVIGHSAYCGMFVDGDGQDRIEIAELNTADYPIVRDAPKGDLEHPVSSSDTYNKKMFRKEEGKW